ncbi:MAG: TAXI family TRAP transporter solute-binding subunit [Rhodospirillaceae bacterium]|nr:TAXI family TRAP transporter solute-binding subunit [Rhodospirillaceae bacterium]
MKRRLLCVFAAFFAAASGTPAAAELQKLVLAAGPQAAPHFAFAKMLCNLVNQQQKRHNLSCELRESKGDVDSLQALDAEEAHIAFARADLLDQAMAGSGPFRDRGPLRGNASPRRSGPNEELRALFALQIETVFVLARADARAKNLTDLAKKRLNIGPPGSGARLMFDLLAPAAGWTLKEFEVAAELDPADEADALCRNRVDAVIYLGANPDSRVRAAAQACDAAPVPVAGSAVEALVKEKRYLVRAPIPGGLYKGAPRETPSIGIPVVAASSGKVDAKLVYEAVKSVFENLGRLQRADPVYARLELRRMFTEGLAAPMHDGAARFYKERGWIR